MEKTNQSYVQEDSGFLNEGCEAQDVPGNQLTVTGKQQAAEHNRQVIHGQNIQNNQLYESAQMMADGNSGVAPDGQSNYNEGRNESNENWHTITFQNGTSPNTVNASDLNAFVGEDHSYPLESNGTTISLPGYSNASDTLQHTGSTGKFFGHPSGDNTIVVDDKLGENKHCEAHGPQHEDYNSKDGVQNAYKETREDPEKMYPLRMFEEEREKQDTLEKLRRKEQTYEDIEDNDAYDDYSAYDYEAYERAREKYVFFWQSHDIYSQWNSRYVFHVDGRKFTSAEQFMMYKKATLFGDDEIADEILWCKSPRKIKALGRQVRGFDQDMWGEHCLHIVKEGNMAKFTQNEDHLADLLFTYPKLLVEASPYDNIWGIGLEENMPEAWDESTWAGTNYLGYVITEVRDDIMVERGMIEDKDREKYIDKLLIDAGYKPVKTAAQQDQIHRQEDYLIFKSGKYSQWHSSHFEVDGVAFSSAEQYMMYKKAVLFEDSEIAKQILNCEKPGKIKALGRKVKGFSEEMWGRHCLQFVKEGNMAKFSQNEYLQKAIVTTYPKIFVEANPYDKIWGIGLTEDDPNARNKNAWQGKNCLGYILTEVRDELLCEWGLLKKDKVVKYMDKLQVDLGTSVDNDIRRNEYAAKNTFEQASPRKSGKTKDHDRHNFDSRQHTSDHEGGGKQSARHGKNPEFKMNEFSRQKDGSQLESDNTKHQGERKMNKFADEYQTKKEIVNKGDRKSMYTDRRAGGRTEHNILSGNETRGDGIHASSQNHLAALEENGFQTQSKKKRNRKKNRKTSDEADGLSEKENKNEENALNIARNVTPNDISQENEGNCKTASQKTKTERNSDKHEATGKIDGLNREKTETGKDAVETMSRSQKKKLERAKKLEAAGNIDGKNDGFDTEKADTEKSASETMSRSQKKKLERAKKEEQAKENDKDHMADEVKPDGQQMSRRQRKNQRKKQK